MPSYKPPAAWRSNSGKPRVSTASPLNRAGKFDNAMAATLSWNPSFVPRAGEPRRDGYENVKRPPGSLYSCVGADCSITTASPQVATIFPIVEGASDPIDVRTENLT